MPKFTAEEQRELEAIEDFTDTNGWRVIRDILKRHKIYLMEESQKHLEKHEDRKAGELLARSKEPDRIIELIKHRRDELRTKQEETQNGNDTQES